VRNRYSDIALAGEELTTLRRNYSKNRRLLMMAVVKEEIKAGNLPEMIQSSSKLRKSTPTQTTNRTVVVDY
jgi:hypothetical protein